MQRSSGDNDADRIHDADAHDNEDHALWQIPEIVICWTAFRQR